MKKLEQRWLLAPLALAAMVAVAPAQASSKQATIAPAVNRGLAPETSNTSPVVNWRLDPTASFNGVANALNGTAALTFRQGGGTYACSGSLLPGGEYILTAAHCAAGVSSMTIEFGLYNNVALETRTATQYIIHPGWVGQLDTGADVALVKLNAPVTNLNAYYLSDTNDTGKEMLISGYGTTGTGYQGNPGWTDSAYGHYGYNTIDGFSSDILAGAEYTPPTYGFTYVADFDSWTDASGNMIADPGRYNTVQRIADARGDGSITSTLAVGAGEALIAGGDSGGGDFVWNAGLGMWILTGVHSWGWNYCPGRIDNPSCDYVPNGTSSYGDLMGSSATFSHIDWIESVLGHSVTAPIPEPGTYALLLAGLGVVGGIARRRRAV